MKINGVLKLTFAGKTGDTVQRLALD